MSSPHPKVLGVLGGRDIAPGALEAWLGWADRVVAADSGADLCRSYGLEPDVIVGDLDSISDPSGLVPDLDQETSDVDKLLIYLAREGIREVTLIGVEGDRLDHVLATLMSVARVPSVSCQIVVRSGSVQVFGPDTYLNEGVKGRVSLLPLMPSRVTLQGVKWPLENEELSPLGRVSLSNQMEGERLSLMVREGLVALFLECDAFPPANG